MGSDPNWYQIGNKTCYIPKLANSMKKKDIYVNNFKRPSLAYQCVFTDQKIIQRGNVQGTTF